MTQYSVHTDHNESSSVTPLTRPQDPAIHYETPAIIHRGKLETRAGSPLANPLEDLLDPGAQ